MTLEELAIASRMATNLRLINEDLSLIAKFNGDMVFTTGTDRAHGALAYQPTKLVFERFLIERKTFYIDTLKAYGVEI